MSDYRVVANVTELPNVTFGHRSLMWWGTLGFIMIEGTTLSASDSHTLDLDMPRAMDLNRVFTALGDAGIRVRSMRTKSNRLEELFVRLTGDEAAAKREQAA